MKKSRDFSVASLAVAAAVLSAVAGTGTPAAASAGARDAGAHRRPPT